MTTLPFIFDFGISRVVSVQSAITPELKQTPIIWNPRIETRLNVIGKVAVQRLRYSRRFRSPDNFQSITNQFITYTI